MNTTRRTARLGCVSVLLAGLVVACGQKPLPPGTAVAMPSESATSSSKEFGDYVVYFNALRTDSLTPEIATSYGIVRSANRALVNISMARKPRAAGNSLPGSVTAEVVNLNGRSRI